MGLSSFNTGYTFGGGHARMLCGGGDGTIRITLTSNAGNSSLWIFCMNGICCVNYNTADNSCSCRTFYSNAASKLSFTTTMTAYPATATTSAYWVLKLVPNLYYQRATMLVNFPDTSGDNAIIGITNNPGEY